jgi:hypothetical protein
MAAFLTELIAIPTCPVQSKWIATWRVPIMKSIPAILAGRKV